MANEAWVEEAYRLPIAQLPSFLSKIEGEAGDLAAEACAVAQYRTGNSDEAKALFAGLGSKHEPDLRTVVLLMRIAFADNDTDSAAGYAKDILEQDPAHAEALRMAGRIYSNAREIDRADRYWRQLADIAPDDHEAPLQVARIAAARGLWDAAALYADLAILASGGAAEPLRIKLDAAIKTGAAAEVAPDLLPLLFEKDGKAANAYLASLSTSLDCLSFATLLGRLRSSSPSSSDLDDLAAGCTSSWLAAGQAAEMASRDEEAGAFYRSIRLVDPDDKGAGDGLRRLVREAVTAMRAAVKAGDGEAAEAAARQVEAIDPDMHEAAFTRGRVAYAAGDMPLAAALFQHSVDLAPENSWYRLNLGRALHAQEKLAEALAQFEQVQAGEDASQAMRDEATTRLASIPRQLMAAGSAHYKAGELEAAWADYTGCRGFGEDGEQVEKMLAAIERDMLAGVTASFKAEDPSALDRAQRFVEKAPENIQGWLILGRLFNNSRDHGRALPVWQKLSELDPDSAHYRLQVARCCDWLKQPELGREAAAAALELDPDLNEAGALMEKFGAASSAGERQRVHAG